VDFAGDGLSMTNYTQHCRPGPAVPGLHDDHQAAKIVNAAGLIPAINGTSTSNPVNQQMLNFVSQQHLTAYPDAGQRRAAQRGEHGSKVLPSVLNGSISPKTALATCRPRSASCPPRRGGPATRDRW